LYAFNSEPQNAYLILYTIALFIYDKATLELEFLKARWLSVITAIVVAAASLELPRLSQLLLDALDIHL
jgi:hypothetical protein